MTEKKISLPRMWAIAHRNFLRINGERYVCDDFGNYIMVDYRRTLVSMSTYGWPEDKWWLRGARRWR